MGNRAVITTKEKRIGIYLHWDGSPSTIKGFLEACKAIPNMRPPEEDCYGWARLCQVICNYVGGTVSVGIDTLDNLDTDNWDNGTYIIEKWEIVGREYNHREDVFNEEKVAQVKEECLRKMKLLNG